MFLDYAPVLMEDIRKKVSERFVAPAQRVLEAVTANRPRQTLEQAHAQYQSHYAGLRTNLSDAP